MNLLKSLTPKNITDSDLNWSHPPEKWEPISGGGIKISVPAVVDYFKDPAGKISKDDAPFLYRQVEGDFIVQAHVRPAFITTYDAGAIMVRQDALHWAKLCFESTDFGTKAAVSVVTRQTSDDANGVNLTVPDVWLQVARQDDVFAMHYALDGKTWQMVRLFRLPMSNALQVGLVAQCPIGPGTSVDFLSFSIDKKPLQNIRQGK